MTRVRRWGRRVCGGLLVIVVLATIASFAYDAATAGWEKGARALYAGPYVVVDGTSIAYRRWGRAGSPIVLVGGFAEPTWVWRGVGALLGRRHRVFALDLPPFGYSERRGPYTLGHWVDLVRGFDRRLRIRRPLVVGHSLGAAVAVSAALRRPRGTAGIVLLDGDALPVGGGAGWISHLLLDPYYTSVFRIVTGSDWIVGRAVRGARGPAAPPPSRSYLELWERPFRVRGTASAFRRLLRSGGHGVSTDDLRRVDVPRLVVWGARDTVDSPDAGRATARMLHARFVVLRGAGHLSMLDDAPGVAALIERAAVAAAGAAA